jgi:hypothetical protein
MYAYALQSLQVHCGGVFSETQRLVAQRVSMIGSSTSIKKRTSTVLIDHLISALSEIIPAKMRRAAMHFPQGDVQRRQ